MRSKHRMLCIADKCIRGLWQLITFRTKIREESGVILLNNYFIAKVGSLDESARLLTSVFAILIGAYLAILINNTCIITVKNLVRMSYRFYDNSFAPILMTFFLTLFPILPWIGGLIISMRILRPERPSFTLSSKMEDLSKFLIDIIDKKYKKLLISYFLLFAGVFLLLVILGANILGPVYFPYMDAKAYYNESEYEDAIKYCDKSIAEIPDFEFAWRLKGKSYLMLGNYSEAIKSYNESIRLNPNSIDSYMGRGLAYLSLFKYYEAIADFNQGIILDPSNSEIWFYKGRTHESVREYGYAIDAFNNATKINSRYSVAWYHTGLSFYYQNNYTGALMNFDRAIKFEKGNCPEIWFFHKGKAHESLREYSEAIDAFDHAIEINRSFALAWYHKGLSLYNQRNYTGALMNIDEAIKLEHENCSAKWFFHKARALASLEKYDEAIKTFDEAIRADPNYALAWFYKGIALYRQGNDDGALVAFARVEELDPILAKEAKKII